MSGNLEGGRKARDTNKERHGPDFYQKIGALGGTISKRGGFWYAKYVLGDDEHAREAGRRGGITSRRGKIIKEVDMGAMKDKQLQAEEDGTVEGESEV